MNSLQKAFNNRTDIRNKVPANQDEDLNINSTRQYIYVTVNIEDQTEYASVNPD